LDSIYWQNGQNGINWGKENPRSIENQWKSFYLIFLHSLAKENFCINGTASYKRETRISAEKIKFSIG
jgi:hypothetical protein